MKIAVIGATGATGQLAIAEGIARGHEVVAYVRDAKRLGERPGLRIITGELTDQTGLRAALSDVDAVLCCLGTHDKKNIDLMQKSMPLIIDAVSDEGRLVLLSAFGVGDTALKASLLARLVYKVVVASVYYDKRRSEDLLFASDLKWTIVYPVILTDDGFSSSMEVRQMEHLSRVKGLPKVPRANVARAMLNACETPDTIGQRLLLAPRSSIL